MSKRALAVVVGVALPLAALAACGSRTGLLVPGDVYVEPDGSVVHVFPDASVLEDAPDDTLPPLDTAPIRDANNPFCADASDTLIYVVTTSNIGTGVAAIAQLLRFDPASSAFTIIGDLSCPDPYGRTPFSMAVNRFGIAYVLYADATGGTVVNPPFVFRVSLATAQCETTTFNPPSGFEAFGMAFSADDTGNTETLYVASDDPTSGVLGAVNETTLTLKAIGQIAPNAPAAELTGSSDGRLFAFFNPTPPAEQLAGMTVAQIDKTTAQLSAENFLPSVNEGSAWAFAFYGGNFYLFTAPDQQTSIVTRYNPSDGSLTQVAQWRDLITGAGVSTLRSGEMSGAVNEARAPETLAGKRVVLTRARDQAEKSATMLRARGAEPVLLPTIELHPPKDPAAVADALGHLGEFAWVAFTSANGVEWTWKAMEAAGMGAGAFAGCRIAAIGPGTAAELEARGVRVDVTATEKKGEGLARAMLEVMKRSGESVLLLRAQIARDVLPDTLRDAGHTVAVVAVYETRPAEGDAVDAVLKDIAAGGIDAVTFTSASTVDNFVTLVGSEGRARDLLSRTLVASIGPITSEALSARALPVDVTARDSTIAGLLEAIESSLGRIRHV